MQIAPYYKTNRLISRQHKRLIVGFALLVIILFCTINVSAGIKNNYKRQLQKRLASIKKISRCKRLYIFTGLNKTSQNVHNLLGKDKLFYFDFYRWKGEPLAEKLKIISGPFSNKNAVQIDQCSFKGLPHNPQPTGFTVACWIKISGHGTILDKSGRKHGTIIVTGNGYNNGWRLTTGSSGHRIYFSMGKINGPTRISCPGIIGKWFFLVASWDGKHTKLYNNSKLVAHGIFKKYRLIRRKRLIIGYDRGHGLGSIKLGIAEVAIFERALTSVEIKNYFITR